MFIKCPLFQGAETKSSPNIDCPEKATGSSWERRLCGVGGVEPGVDAYQDRKC